MFKELLQEFTNHQVQDAKFDVDTIVIQNYKLKPGLYFRLRENNEIDCYFVKKSIAPDNDPLVEWFKEADFVSTLIEMNKPIDPKKQIHSNNIYTLFCKHDVFIANRDINSDLIEHINRYFEALPKTKDKKSAEILATAGYKSLSTEIIEECKTKFLNSLDCIKDMIILYDIKDNSYVKLFLDVPIEKYQYESGRYLLPRIFNSNNYNIKIDEQVIGLSNANMGMNAKKPYLEHKTTEFKVPYRITAEDGVLLHKFFLWLNGLEQEEKALYAGYIPVGDHLPGLFAVAEDIKVRRPAMYVHLDRGINVTIDEYDFLPMFNNKMDKPIHFKDYFDLPNYPSKNLNKLNEVEAHINFYLYGGHLIRNYYTEKVRVTDNLSGELAVQIVMSRNAMHDWLRKGNEVPIRSCVDRVTMNVLLARLQNLEYISALAQTLNVRLTLLNYFNGEENDMGYALEETYLSLKDKVLSKSKNEHIACQNSLEFYIAVGQILYYYFSLSQAQKMHYDVLWRGIASAKNIKTIKEEHYKYFFKYSHAIDFNNQRFNNMLSIVTSYAPEKEEAIELDALFYGFASSNIIYFKEEDENKQQDTEEVKPDENEGGK